MKIQTINYKPNTKIQFRNSSSLSPKTNIQKIAPKQTSINSKETESFKKEAISILDALSSIKETADFITKESKGILYDSKQHQKRGEVIFESIQEKIKEMENKGKNPDKFEYIIMDLSDDAENISAFLKDGKAVVFISNKNSKYNFSRYEFDLKTGELLSVKKDCTIYSGKDKMTNNYPYVLERLSSRYEAEEEYYYKDSQLLTCNLGVSNGDFKRCNKRYNYIQNNLLNCMIGVEEDNKTLHAQRRFSFIGDNQLMSYYRNYKIQAKQGLRSADVLYEINSNGELHSFAKNFEQDSISNWGSKQLFQFNNRELKSVIIGERKNMMTSTYKQKYEF